MRTLHLTSPTVPVHSARKKPPKGEIQVVINQAQMVVSK